MIPSYFPPMPCSFLLLPIPTTDCFPLCLPPVQSLASSINTAETQAPPLLPRTFAQLFKLCIWIFLCTVLSTGLHRQGQKTQRSFSIHSPKTVLLKLQPELPALPPTSPSACSFHFSWPLLSSIICAMDERSPSRLPPVLGPQGGHSSDY